MWRLCLRSLATSFKRHRLGDDAEGHLAPQVGWAHEQRGDGEGGPVEGAVEHAEAGGHDHRSIDRGPELIAIKIRALRHVINHI